MPDSSSLDSSNKEIVVQPSRSDSAQSASEAVDDQSPLRRANDHPAGRDPSGPEPVDRSPRLKEGDAQGSESPQQVEYRLCSPQLPLAVYREVAAHLRQVEGVVAGLLPQTSTKFDYLQSQVGGIWIRYRADALDWCQPQVEAILTYYGDRYGNWETLSK